MSLPPVQVQESSSKQSIGRSGGVEQRHRRLEMIELTEEG
ncbi:hypothetical protein LINPERPRIM_LOCUS40285 [Linum perenne]